MPTDIKSTVIKLKRELERMKIVPIDRIQLLTYGGREMVNSRTLIDYGIEPDSTILL